LLDVGFGHDSLDLKRQKNIKNLMMGCRLRHLHRLLMLMVEPVRWAPVLPAQPRVVFGVQQAPHRVGRWLALHLGAKLKVDRPRPQCQGDG
jgi:hypothetical protein